VTVKLMLDGTNLKLFINSVLFVTNPCGSMLSGTPSPVFASFSIEQIRQDDTLVFSALTIRTP
jgi:hypothetical protein